MLCEEPTATWQKSGTWWNDTRQSIDARVAELRADRDYHRAAHDLKKAEQRAEDAVLARLDADDLAASERA